MEIILFVLTFWRWYVMRKSHQVGMSIIHIFFRDGMIYFAIIFGAVSLLVCEPELLVLTSIAAMAAWSLITYLYVTISLVGSAF